MDERCELLWLDLELAEGIRASILTADEASKGAGRARGLSDPSRLTLAAALAEADELCVCDLAWITGRPQNLVSHHLRALRSAGLVTSRRDGKMILYALTTDGRQLLSVLLSSRVPV